MTKQDQDYDKFPVDWRKYELEARAAQVQAMRDTTSFLTKAVRRLFTLPTSILNGTDRNGSPIGHWYSKRMSHLRNGGIPTSLL